ncbi:MAG: dCTP deaminase [Parcubacteria group bacterium Gr01-1014_18]|nr:MAG: dCTP deaminase [Parcubacteria group bacterium Greene0416_36]TSC79782.1 MAG: dCTP deaminase [Parcubacteria group bacterium Gr01-1014_18]TSC98066.1 MAG: dCTP deaminase [Parcubacteria group bacterium Greene1014_20]
MILTHHEIRNFIQEGKLNFEPVLDAFQLQPHAVDLRLGYHFKIPKEWEVCASGRCALNIDYLSQKETSNFHEIELAQKQYFEILPQETVIAKTLEKITISDGGIMAVLYPRSSLNRRGLAVDLSGIVDTYYSGNLIIPIKNNTRQIIRLYPGERICQLVFQKLARTLSLEESKNHGLSPAKYSDTAENLYKQDTNSEMDYIVGGRIEELKGKFRIN